ncbi:MAG: hypothetical protein AAGB05_13345 [Pseudomonadota bacterium]
MALATLNDDQKRFVEKYLGTAVDLSDAGPSKARKAWEATAPKLDKRVTGLVESGAPLADKLAEAWGQAGKVANSGNYPKAMDAAKKVAAGIDKIARAKPQVADAKGIGGVSLVKLGIARAEWPKIHANAHSALETLISKLRTLYGPYSNEAAQLDLAVAQIERIISTLDERLKSQLDDVYNAQNEHAREITIDRVRSTVAEFTNFVDTDPVALAIDHNSFTPGLAPMAPIRRNLHQMMSALDI